MQQNTTFTDQYDEEANIENVDKNEDNSDFQAKPALDEKKTELPYFEPEEVIDENLGWFKKLRY